MSDTLTYRQMGTAARSQAHTLFAQTMHYVAATADLFALGCLIGTRFAVRRSLGYRRGPRPQTRVLVRDLTGATRQPRARR